MTTVRDALASAVEVLAAAGVDTPRLDAELLLARAMGTAREALYAEPEQPVGPSASRELAQLVRRRESREPVAYILGQAFFRRLTLAVDRRVLIPRPETELLVDLVADGQRVLDVGTGSGAVALAVADEYAGVTVTGTDRSAGALDVARENARRLGLDVTWLEADLVAGGPYDTVLANPPYVREDEWQNLEPEIVDYEPRGALVAGTDGLDVIRRLLPAALEVLKMDGMLGLEVGHGQAPAVSELARGTGFGEVGANQDLAGVDRVVWCRR